MDQDLRALQRAAEADPADRDAARRYDEALRRAGDEEALFERYRFKFLCPLAFEDLTEGLHPFVRDCAQCERSVFYCRSPEELAEHVEAGDCVAFHLDALGDMVSAVAETGASTAEEPGSVCLVRARKRPPRPHRPKMGRMIRRS